MIATAYPATILFLKAFGFGSLSGNIGITSELGILVASFSLAWMVTTAIAVISGFKERYGMCSVIALAALIIDLALMFVTHNIIFAIIEIIMIAVYIIFAAILKKKI